MALKPVASSSSVVLLQKEETKTMLRSVMQRSKSQSNLLAEAMRTYETKEQEYLNTIQKTGEMYKSLLALYEKLEAKHNDLLLLHERKMGEEKSRIKKLSAQGTQDLDAIHKDLEEITYLQDQKRICSKAHSAAMKAFGDGLRSARVFNHPADPKEGFHADSNAAYLAFLKGKLDPSYHDRIQKPYLTSNIASIKVPDSDTPFEKETALKIKDIEERVDSLLKEIQRAEAAMAAEEPNSNQNS